MTVASAGKKLTSYVSFITGPSSTTDIEKEHIVGVHGPEEVHIIILDGGRLALAKSADFKKLKKEHKAAFKKVAPRYKLKSGKWKAGGFKRAVKEAHKIAGGNKR